MRCLLALGIVLCSAVPVHADDELAHTRAVLRRHADASRTLQTIGGVAMIAGGAAMGGAGYYVVVNVKEGGFVDLSALERAIGYTMIGIGGLAVITGTLLVLAKNDYERMAEEVTGERDAQYARTEIAHKAASGRRTRMVMRGVGFTLLGVGAVGATVALAGGDGVDRDTRNDLLGAGLALGTVGTGFVVGSLFETRWEQMHDDLQARRVQVTAGAIPVRGGVVLGIAGTF